MDIKIRHITLDDWEPLKDLFLSIQHDRQINHMELSLEKLQHNFIRSLIDGSLAHCLVGYKDDTLRGFFFYTIMQNQSSPVLDLSMFVYFTFCADKDVVKLGWEQIKELAKELKIKHITACTNDRSRLNAFARYGFKEEYTMLKLEV